MKLKNGWPWSSLQNTGHKIPQELIDAALNVSKNTDWEKCRRPLEQRSIYPHTRVREWRHHLPNDPVDEDVKNLTQSALEVIGPAFPECDFYRSELIYMVPNGRVSWHYDIRKAHYYSTKVMILLDNEDVNFYFAPWNKDVTYTIPLNETLFNESNTIHTRMKTGCSYIFNHRIPHSTENNTDRSRLMLMIEFMPKDLALTEQYSVYTTRPDEYEALAPPVL